MGNEQSLISCYPASRKEDVSITHDSSINDVQECSSASQQICVQIPNFKVHQRADQVEKINKIGVSNQQLKNESELSSKEIPQVLTSASNTNFKSFVDEKTKRHKRNFESHSNTKDFHKLNLNRISNLGVFISPSLTQLNKKSLVQSSHKNSDSIQSGRQYTEEEKFNAKLSEPVPKFHISSEK